MAEQARSSDVSLPSSCSEMVNIMHLWNLAIGCASIFALLLIGVAAHDSGVSYQERVQGSEIYHDHTLYGVPTGEVRVFYHDGTPKLHMYKGWDGSQHFIRYDESGEEVDHLIKY